MRIVRAFAFVLLVMLASGCILNASVSVSLDELMNGNADARAAFVDIYGVNCDNPTGRAKLERLMRDTFQGAQYEACDSGTTSKFSIPLLVIRSAGTDPAPGYLSIASFDERLLGFRIPEKLAKKLEALRARAEDTRFKARLEITNDTGKPIPISVRSVYANDVATLRGDGVLAPGDVIHLELSDVLAEAILQQRDFTVVSAPSAKTGEHR